MDTSSEQLEKKLIRQFEYYFGDFNLSKDSFLKEKSKEDAGWITLETFLTFKRLKDLCTDAEVIIAALEKSASGLLEISEDKTKIRRNLEKPLPSDEELKKSIDERTNYAKGFPLDSKLDSLIEFLETYGPVDNVFMRRTPRGFKGSVLVTFTTKEGQTKMLESCPISYKDTELVVKTKSDYFEGKQNEKDDRNSTKKGEKRKAPEENSTTELVKGCLLKIEDIKETTKWEDIKQIFSPHAAVLFVDYSLGRGHAIVKFEKENTAQVALDKCLAEGDNKLVISEKEVKATVLEGTEEESAWEKLDSDRTKTFKKWKQSRRGGGRQDGNKHKRFRRN